MKSLKLEFAWVPMIRVKHSTETAIGVALLAIPATLAVFSLTYKNKSERILSEIAPMLKEIREERDYYRNKIGLASYENRGKNYLEFRDEALKKGWKPFPLSLDRQHEWQFCFGLYKRFADPSCFPLSTNERILRERQRNGTYKSYAYILNGPETVFCHEKSGHCSHSFQNLAGDTIVIRTSNSTPRSSINGPPQIERLYYISPKRFDAIRFDNNNYNHWDHASDLR